MTLKQYLTGALVAAAVGGGMMFVAAAPDGAKPTSVAEELRELKRRADDADTKYGEQQKKNSELEAELAKARRETADEVAGRKGAVQGVADGAALLALNNPPVGSVVAYAGPWPPSEAKVPAAQNQAIKWEEHNGWALCNGASFNADEFQTLKRALRGTQLPNYQGYFLRGYDPTGKQDPDRLAAKKALGSTQDDAVGPFKSSVTATGPISVTYLDWQVSEWGTPNNENDNAASGGRGYKATADVARTATGTATLQGSTTVTEGGGKDTRPKNIAVNYLIKVR